MALHISAMLSKTCMAGLAHRPKKCWVNLQRNPLCTAWASAHLVCLPAMVASVLQHLAREGDLLFASHQSLGLLESRQMRS